MLDAHPTDLLALRIYDTTWFRFGQTAKILEQADRVAAGWSAKLEHRRIEWNRTVGIPARDEV
jgi:hypothetical protein